jgi:putative ribosome biogenesis GTPase RsgA
MRSTARTGECRGRWLVYLKLGDSAVLVGSSGAGKSTLTNTLLG